MKTQKNIYFSSNKFFFYDFCMDVLLVKLVYQPGRDTNIENSTDAVLFNSAVV